MILAKSTSILTLLTSLAILASAAPASANLIINGSFENGTSQPGPGGESLPIGDTTVTGWTVIGNASSGHNVAWLANGNNFGVSTPFGSNFLDLTGYSDSTPYAGVGQTIATIVGQTYSLSFSIGVDQGSGIYGGPVGVTASTTGASQTFIYNPAGTGNLWETAALTFKATSTSTDISLSGFQGTQYIGLDNVAVNSVSSVPLPASAPMFGAAILVLGAVGYGMKRKKAAAAV